MNLEALTAISPVDGRYRKKTTSLAAYFSEFALIKYRVKVEIEYFIALVNLPLPQLKKFPKEKIRDLRLLYENFSLTDAQKIKDTERITNHDVKAVEYFIKEQFENLGIGKFSEFVHFGLTSQDINNTAVPLSLMDFYDIEYNSALEELTAKLDKMSEQFKDIPMLARTHGQPASPTRLGKELNVFVERLDEQAMNLNDIPLTGKFGGATGNFNAHHVAYPETDWKKFADNFYELLGLQRQQFTTQIEHYDHLAAFFDNLKRINIILLDLCRDVWTYISLDYFKQKINKDEVGSSAMPHKVNPIDFENAEGNLGVANALLIHLAEKLPVSRLQRDLTDSTALRNIGVPLAHTLIAFDSIKKGLDKLIVNEQQIHADLENNWAVVAEAIQTVLRREGYPKPYEKLKELTRNNEKITAVSIGSFIDSLDVSDKLKKELKAITPFNYTGI
jgi:adenylosuccinate lyase